MMRDEGGFTLLEMIVALVVLGFLILGLSQGIRFSLTARRTQAALEAKADGLDAVDRVLRGLITHMDPGGFDAPPTLAGTLNHMTFLTELPPGAAVDGIRQARVRLAVDPAGELVLAWQLAPNAIALRPPPQGRVVLLHHVARLAIAYDAPPSAHGRGGWQRRWSAVPLPALVRIRIVFSRADPRLWPDIVARPRRQRRR